MLVVNLVEKYYGLRENITTAPYMHVYLMIYSLLKKMYIFV